MENQILYADSTVEVTSSVDLSRQLLRKEQRLLERLQEEQEVELRAQERFKRAETRLQRKRKRVERIQRKLALVREQLAGLQTTDQQEVYREHEVILVPLPEETLPIASEEDSLIQPEQDGVPTQEADDRLPAYTEAPVLDTSVPVYEATSIQPDIDDIPAIDGEQEKAQEQTHSLPQQETTSPVPFTYETIETLAEPELESTSEERSEVEHFSQQVVTSQVPLTSLTLESTPESDTPASYAETDISSTSVSEDETNQELENNSPTSIESTIINDNEQEPAMNSVSNEVEDEAEVGESADISSEKNTDRRSTNPLQLEHSDPSATVSDDSLVQSAKEAWIAAESAMQHARNAANGITASVSFLSQTELSNEFMEELVRKQADANRELLKAQDTARAAYERFVQVQKDSQSAASEPMNTSDDASVPPSEENGLDQTAKLQAVRLYTEW